MRLIFTLGIAVILSVVFCQTEVYLQHNSPSNPSHPTYPTNPQPVQNYTLTIQQYKQKYGKTYISAAEEQYRQYLIQINLQKINSHNHNPNKTYVMRPNIFLDLDRSQFISIYMTTYKPNNYSKSITHGFSKKKYANNAAQNAVRDKGDKATPRKTIRNSRSTINKINLPIISSPDLQISATASPKGRNLQAFLIQYINNKTNRSLQLGKANDLNSENEELMNSNLFIDWTLYSGKVNYQGICGACYSFSSVDAVSAAFAIQKNSFYTQLSIQQIIDCSDFGLSFGCKGGHLDGAYAYMQMKGITLSFEYPYTNQQRFHAGKCKVEGGAYKITSFDQIEEGDCNGILRELKNGPVSVGISGYNLQYYSSGVFSGCHSQPEDHAVLIIGYDSRKGWKIKNSWSQQWGQNGYGWIAPGNTCGICNLAILFRL